MGAEYRQPKRGIGEEDRVHTCTSRILEGRSGGQADRQVGSPAPDKGTRQARSAVHGGIPTPLQSLAQCCARLVSFFSARRQICV